MPELNAVEGQQEEFDKVFESQSGGDGGGSDVQPPPAPEPPPPAAPKTPETPVPPAPPEPPPADDEPAFKQRYQTLQGIFRHEKEEWEAREAELKAELEAKIEAATKAEPPPNKEESRPSDFQSIINNLNLTEEEKAQLAEYDEDFDVVSKMEGIKRQKGMERLWTEFNSALEKMEKRFLGQLEERTKPVETFISETKTNREEEERALHFRTIGEAHPDYEKYIEDKSIVKWIESKPKYLQAGLKSVYAQGTAEDVVELLDDFKRESNIVVTPQPSTTKADRLRAMTPPPTRRGAVNATMSVASDFEGAFDEALHKGA